MHLPYLIHGYPFQDEVLLFPGSILDVENKFERVKIEVELTEMKKIKPSINEIGPIFEEIKLGKALEKTEVYFVTVKNPKRKVAVSLEEGTLEEAAGDFTI